MINRTRTPPQQNNERPSAETLLAHPWICSADRFHAVATLHNRATSGTHAVKMPTPVLLQSKFSQGREEQEGQENQRYYYCQHMRSVAVLSERGYFLECSLVSIKFQVVVKFGEVVAARIPTKFNFQRLTHVPPHIITRRQ